ncbi:prepilin-type N-terminal cleavage/methylation domain-containing protein [Oleisolibacter albus]|uniref:prepilin-type N-terminal cleavage/methylation domain-containing protein n=1 Tax=Oleisolibacter albus TaxID=2171757 RepID=UPI000DF17E7E|nr:prepilin-type N-terminal cleavage/methylation domain-containing protein [Oleisolibacter albus]
MPPRSAQAGFTLMEMLVTLAVAALIGAIAAPRLELAVQALELGGSARQLALDLARARAMALRRGEVVALSLLSDGQGYRSPAGTVRLPAGLRLDGPAEIRFGADGQTAGARLLLTGTRRRIALEIGPVAGTISLERLPAAGGRP